MKLLRKKNKIGFSLAETLIALLIILLVSSVVAVGMPAAKQAYFKVVESANAQVFLSTTLTKLQDELTTAREIKYNPTSRQLNSYVNPKTGDSTITFDAGEGQFVLRTYLDLSIDPKVNPARPLVPKAIRTNSLRIQNDPTIGNPTIIFNSDNTITVSAFDIWSDVTQTKVAGLEHDYTFQVIVPSN